MYCVPSPSPASTVVSHVTLVDLPDVVSVQVNGVVEIRRGRKLRAGDAVRLGAQQVQLQAATA